MHACALLAEAARGSHLLFIDADVRLAPEAAAALAEHAAARGIAMVSGVPRQRILSLGEALTVPAINLLLLGYLPGGGRAFTRRPDLAAACGQLVLCDRAAYAAIGGHGAVRGVLHDGLALARRFRLQGLRTEVVDGAPLATCRMYRGFRESWAGFVKNAREDGDAAWPAGLDHPAGRGASLALGAAALRPGGRRDPADAGAARRHHPARAGALVDGAAAPADRRGGAGDPVGCAGQGGAGPPGGLERPRISGHKGGMSSVAVSATPTRDHDSENFPTASLLLAKPLRAQVMGFYRFVRTADDIADSPDLPAAEKLARLDAMERALDDPATAMPEARRLHTLGVGTGEARLMLSAFRQDATCTRYADWAALEDYCRRSADPVGRMLLRLHGDGDNATANAAADALCTALQLLNHLQDLVPDRAALDRIYLPEPWLALAGGTDAFFEPANAARRRCWMPRSTGSRRCWTAPARCRGCCGRGGWPGNRRSPSPWPGGCWRGCAPTIRCSAASRWARPISPVPSPPPHCSGRGHRGLSPPEYPVPAPPSPAAWRR
ncbi:squalene/phytoene synthase family protein [Siccirubricoccus deserti]